jgi:hypothetical protein
MPFVLQPDKSGETTEPLWRKPSGSHGFRSAQVPAPNAWMHHRDWDSDADNWPLTPNWASYQAILASRGFCLDTLADVKQFYSKCSPERRHDLELNLIKSMCTGSLQHASDSMLCPDAGLVSRLHCLIPTQNLRPFSAL